MMQLYFLRHGEAEKNGSLPDSKRSLTARGESQAQAVGSALRKADVHFDAVLCSPLLRARQTAGIVCHTLGATEAQVTEHLSPSADRSRLYDMLAALEAQRVLLVGHEPLISDTVCDLIGAHIGRIAVRTAGLVRLDVEGSVKSGQGALQFLLPQELAAHLLR